MAEQVSIESLREMIAKDYDDKISSVEFENKYFGSKGLVKQVLQTIGAVPKEQRAEYGKQINDVKMYAESILEQLSYGTAMSDSSAIDVTAPFDINISKDKRPKVLNTVGHINPLNQELEYILNIFAKMGFEVMESRQLDDDYHMFESLNFPKGHPARDVWDSFWTEEGFTPPAHTSTMQNRAIRTHQPPIRFVIPGACYRNEATDPGHEHSLFQIEGVYIDKDISVGDMIGTIKAYLEAFFDMKLNVKIQMGFFPFTEPSAEFSISCPFCGGTGCATCGYSGWIEAMGCGMIHPNVLTEAGVDSKTYSGFAWGFGLDRLVMIKNGIKEVRKFRSGDLNFLKQF